MVNQFDMLKDKIQQLEDEKMELVSMAAKKA